MKDKLIKLVLILIFEYTFTIFLFADNFNIQNIWNTGTVNLCIAQDKDGLLWIGTEGMGLFCYNGDKAKRVKICEGKKSYMIIPSVFFDSDGIMWVFIQEQGLFSYNKNTNLWRNYKTESCNPTSLTCNSAHNSPSLIAEDKEGLIWIGTENGLNYYDKKTDSFTQYKCIPKDATSLSDNNIRVVYIDKDDLIWVGTKTGLNCYDKKLNRFICYRHDPRNSNSLCNDCVNTITEEEGGILWVGTDNGLCSFEKKLKRFKHYRHNPNDTNSLSNNQVVHIMMDRFNNLWVCNKREMGVDRYDKTTNKFSHIRYLPKNLNGINPNQPLCSFEDKTGIIWLINVSGGIDKCVLKQDIFRGYFYDPYRLFSVSSDNVAKLYEDKSGNVWIGTYKGGLCLYTEQDQFENFKQGINSYSLPGSTVSSILDAPDNKLWLGVSHGFICLFDTKTKRVINSFKNPYDELTPFYLTQDNNNPNILWFACSYAAGLFKFDTITGEFTAYKHDPNNSDSISSNSTWSILQDDTILWLATEGDGLCKFDKTTGKCIYYRHNSNDRNSISSDVVIQSYVDSKGNFWVTTEGGGLNKFDKYTGRFTTYGRECGFPSGVTVHILEDKNGCLWMSTYYGIVQFDPKKLKVVKWFTTTDGLPGNSFHAITRPLKDAKGNFWFAGFGDFSLCKFNPEEASKIEMNSRIPTIAMSSFKSKKITYNEDEIDKLKDIGLKWPDNTFEFTFIVIDYTAPEKNQYAYKLEGLEKDWNYIGTNRFGRYTNIPPGIYKLHLKGSNNDGVWNEEGISIKITIMPPFWMTSWFKILVGLTIFSIVGGAVYLRVRILKNIAMRDHAVAEVAEQVAHDIRSPLAALRTALTQVKELSEHNRILLRTATNRIADIIHNLTVKYDAEKKGGSEIHLKVELISSLLEHLVAEKRSQMLEKSIDLALEINDNAHSCFANLEPGKFKRVISNLVNNAAEAIETSNGIIRIFLEKDSSSDNSLSTINYQPPTNTLTIKIIDNGKGIPDDILLKIKQGKKASTKKDGQGIGVSSAVKNISTWGGSYDIQSKVGEGTTFTITLPIAKEPDWFQDIITMPLNTHLVVLDDDESIHRIWESRFRELIEKKTVTIGHFYDSLAFKEYYLSHRNQAEEDLATPTCPAEVKCESITQVREVQNLSSAKKLFLVDYELINSKETGLDLIEQLNLNQQAILVTSRYEEENIRERIKTLGIKIIPKSFAPYIPIVIEKEPSFIGQPDLIFIDNDKFLTDVWELQASSVNKKIAVFNHSEDFKKVMDSYDKNIPIYIDSDLNEKLPGEIIAKILYYEQGFKTIYLATGYDKGKFDHMPWIKDIVSKEPPF